MATIYNRATMTYNNITTSSNIAQGNLVEALTASKTAITDSYNPGDVVTFVLSINNTSSAAFSGLSISDNLGAYSFGTSGSLVPLDYISNSVRYYSNGVLQSAPTVVEGPPLNISGVSVPAGGNTLIIYAARVNEFAPLNCDAAIDNSARISGASLAAPIVVSGSVRRECGLQLGITKSIYPDSVVEGEAVTYTITIQNTGNTAAVATDNVVISDMFSPILNITGVTFNGAAWTSPANYSYNQATGLFTTLAGQITVPAATYAQDATTGVWTLTPGISTLRITGTL